MALRVFLRVLGFGGYSEAAQGPPVEAFQGQRSMAAPVTEEASSEDSGNSGEDGG